MTIPELLQRCWRRVELTAPSPGSSFRRLIWRLRGARIGRGTNLPKCFAVWPHQLQLGRRCVLQHHIFFNYDHYWQPGPSIIIGDEVFIGEGVEFNCRERIEIGDGTLIAAGCRFIDHNHVFPRDPAKPPPEDVSAPIRVGAGAWLGANAVVLMGVTIGAGAVVGAGSVVTKSIPAGERWVGTPAKPIGKLS